MSKTTKPSQNQSQKTTAASKADGGKGGPSLRDRGTPLYWIRVYSKKRDRVVSVPIFTPPKGFTKGQWKQRMQARTNTKGRAAARVRKAKSLRSAREAGDSLRNNPDSKAAARWVGARQGIERGDAVKARKATATAKMVATKKAKADAAKAITEGYKRRGLDRTDPNFDVKRYEKAKVLREQRAAGVVARGGTVAVAGGGIIKGDSHGNATVYRGRKKLETVGFGRTANEGAGKLVGAAPKVMAGVGQKIHDEKVRTRARAAGHALGRVARAATPAPPPAPPVAKPSPEQARTARYDRLITKVNREGVRGTKASESRPVVESTYRGSGVNRDELARRRQGIAGVLKGVRAKRAAAAAAQPAPAAYKPAPNQGSLAFGKPAPARPSLREQAAAHRASKGTSRGMKTGAGMTTTADVAVSRFGGSGRAKQRITDRQSGLGFGDFKVDRATALRAARIIQDRQLTTAPGSTKFRSEKHERNARRVRNALRRMGGERPVR